MAEPIDTVVIRVRPHSEGGFSIDVYATNEKRSFFVTDVWGNEVEPTDGGTFEAETILPALEDAVDTVKRLLA